MALSVISLKFKRDAAMDIRRSWEDQWNDIRDYVHPSAESVTSVGSRGERMSIKMYDGTASWANEQLASGLQTFLTSPTERWFNLEFEDYDYQSDEEALAWLEAVSDVIYNIYSRPITNFMDSFHECYLDLGAFGTSIIYQEWNSQMNNVLFRSIPVPSVYVLEAANGHVDTLFRKLPVTSRQLNQMFPDHVYKKAREDQEGSKCHELWHGVFPRTDQDINNLTSSNKKFASVWWVDDGMYVFKESGFDNFPYHVPRWMKRGGEVYGRSPAMTCLPDIKMTNIMEKYQIRAIQKMVDPPILVPNEGFMLPLDVTPGGVNWFDQGIGQENMIVPLATGGQPEFGEEKLEQKRTHILRCFFADWIVRAKKRERQTAVEIMDDRTEMLQLMAPIIGRMMTELLGPCIRRTYSLLLEHRRIPQVPEHLLQLKLKIGYVSPAAKAQEALKGTAMTRYLQELLPLAQVDPSVLDVIDLDKYAQEMSIVQNVSRTIIRPPEEVEQIRADRAKMEQAQQMAEIAKPASEAIKNISQAGAEVPTQDILANL